MGGRGRVDEKGKEKGHVVSTGPSFINTIIKKMCAKIRKEQGKGRLKINLKATARFAELGVRSCELGVVNLQSKFLKTIIRPPT